MGVLWRLGGADKFLGLKGNGMYRDVGAPVLVLAYASVYDHSWLGLALALSGAGALYGSTFLPISLIGDEDMNAPWWFPILGLVYGSPAFILSLFHRWAFGLTLAICVSAVLCGLKFWEHELPNSQHKDRRKWVEILTGFSIAVSCVLAILIK